jgi:NADPH:quinone reductase-like Zn-dependent oxidoreductase
MRAVYFEAHGGPEVLTVGTLPDPTPGPGEVRVRVAAVALNHLDIWVRRGLPGVAIPLPHVGGSDVAGTVDQVGPGVEEWRPGDPVIIDPSLNPVEDEFTRRGERSLSPAYRIFGEHTNGGLAEYTVAPARNLLRKPEALSFEQAAALPLVSQTAWRAMVVRGQLRPGETCLILGGAGGVASLAIQIAKLAGATVLATASNERKAEAVRALGADHVIPTGKNADGSGAEPISKAVRRLTGKRGVDLVLENVGAATWIESLKSCAKGGRIVTYGATTGATPQTDIRIIFWNQLTILGSTMGSRGDLEVSLRLAAEGKLRPVIDRVVPLAEGRAAYDALEQRQVVGKVVLEPQAQGT